MQPAFSEGDLAVVRPKSRYYVGDVVAYRSATEGRVILHRVVAVSDGQWLTMQGDNNARPDAERPPSEAVVGAVALRVPQGAQLLKWLQVFGLLALVALLGMAALRPAKNRVSLEVRPA